LPLNPTRPLLFNSHSWGVEGIAAPTHERPNSGHGAATAPNTTSSLPSQHLGNQPDPCNASALEQMNNPGTRVLASALVKHAKLDPTGSVPAPVDDTTISPIHQKFTRKQGPGEEYSLPQHTLSPYQPYHTSSAHATSWLSHCRAQKVRRPPPPTLTHRPCYCYPSSILKINMTTAQPNGHPLGPVAPRHLASAQRRWRPTGCPSGQMSHPSWRCQGWAWTRRTIQIAPACSAVPSPAGSPGPSRSPVREACPARWQAASLPSMSAHCGPGGCQHPRSNSRRLSAHSPPQWTRQCVDLLSSPPRLQWTNQCAAAEAPPSPQCAAGGACLYPGATTQCGVPAGSQAWLHRSTTHALAFPHRRGTTQRHLSGRAHRTVPCARRTGCGAGPHTHWLH